MYYRSTRERLSNAGQVHFICSPPKFNRSVLLVIAELTPRLLIIIAINVGLYVVVFLRKEEEKCVLKLFPRELYGYEVSVTSFLSLVIRGWVVVGVSVVVSSSHRQSIRSVYSLLAVLRHTVVTKTINEALLLYLGLGLALSECRRWWTYVCSLLFIAELTYDSKIDGV